MTRAATDLMLLLGDSFPALLIVRVTMVTAVTLALARMAKRCRASLRHTILAAGFPMVLVLPVTSTVIPRFEIKLPVQQNAARLNPIEAEGRVLSQANNAIITQIAGISGPCSELEGFVEDWRSLIIPELC
jgi:hypothetical protein